LALHKPVESSGLATELAVDGNADVNNPKTCAYTIAASGPWWRVNLEKKYSIQEVSSNVGNKND